MLMQATSDFAAGIDQAAIKGLGSCAPLGLARMRS
jgi:hypothetical protein